MRSLPSRSQAGEPRCQLRVANLLIPSWMVTVQSRKASVCESRPSTGHLSGLAVTLLQPGSGQSRRKIRSQPSLKLGLKLPKSTCLGRQKQTVLGPDGGNGIRSSHVVKKGIQWSRTMESGPLVFPRKCRLSSVGRAAYYSGGEGSRTPVLEAVYTSFYMFSR